MSSCAAPASSSAFPCWASTSGSNRNVRFEEPLVRGTCHAAIGNLVFIRGALVISPSAIDRATDSTRSQVSPPWAPAFIASAPPTVARDACEKLGRARAPSECTGAPAVCRARRRRRGPDARPIFSRSANIFGCRDNNARADRRRAPADCCRAEPEDRRIDVQVREKVDRSSQACRLEEYIGRTANAP